MVCPKKKNAGNRGCAKETGISYSPKFIPLFWPKANGYIRSCQGSEKRLPLSRPEGQKENTNLGRIRVPFYKGVPCDTLGQLGLGRVGQLGRGVRGVCGGCTWPVPPPEGRGEGTCTPGKPRRRRPGLPGGTEGTEEGQRGPPPVRVGQDDTRQNTKGALGRGERNPGRGRRIRTGGGQHACELLGSRFMLMGGEVPVQ